MLQYIISLHECKKILKIQITAQLILNVTYEISLDYP